MYFSIIIPTYNNAVLLKRTLNSIENQNGKNFELIVVDNHSKDETDEIIKKCSVENLIYKKINNEGVIAKSRNLGIKFSKGDWLIFLDSDDLLHENKINFLNNNLTKEYDLVCNAEKIVNLDTGADKIWKYGPLKKNFYQKMLTIGNQFSTSASVVKKDFIIQHSIYFNEKKDFITAEDYDFFLNLVNFGAKIKFFDNILGEHSFYKGSQSSNYNLHKNAVKSVLKHHVFKIQNFSQKKEKLWKSLEWRFILMDFIKDFKEKKYVKSLKYFFQAFYLSPIMVLIFFLKKIKI